MTDYTEKSLLIDGKTYAFRARSGVVLNADQRSDTCVSSNGTGSHTSVTSTVVVTSTIWIRDVSGQEQRLQYGSSIPVRAGDVIHVVSVGKAPLLLSNSTTGEHFDIGTDEEILKLRHPAMNLAAGSIFWGAPTLGWLIGSFMKRGGEIFFFGAMIISAIVLLYVLAVKMVTPKRFRKRLCEVFYESFAPELIAAARQFAPATPASSSTASDNRSEPEATSTGKSFCTSCGAPAHAAAKFCGGCGQKLVPA